MARVKGRRRITCFHEAGHCLARWYFGYSFDRVVVLTVEEVRAGVEPLNRRDIPVRGCEGMIDGYDIDNPAMTRNTVARSEPAELRSWLARNVGICNEIGLIDCCAGIDAEARYTKRSSAACALAGGGGDMQRFRRILERWWPDPSEQRTIALAAEQRSRALVRSREGWAALTAIADELMTRGELAGEEASALCRAAYGGREPQFGCWHEQHWPPSLEMIRAGVIPDPPPLNPAPDSQS
jgi:hypothetical protein